VELVENDPASAGGGTHLLVLVKQTFATTPTQLAIHTDLFGSRGGEQQLAIKAMHDSIAEMAVLRARRPDHQFFQRPAQVAAQYIALGIEHILTGIDHLLFVLTIIVAAAGGALFVSAPLYDRRSRAGSILCLRSSLPTSPAAGGRNFPVSSSSRRMAGATDRARPHRT